MMRFLLLLPLLLWSPLRAHASCVVGTPMLLWSYPADGDRDVPTNATFWVLSNVSSMRRPRAWLNDAPVAVTSEYAADAVGLGLEDVRIQAGELHANTAYTLRVELAYADGSNPQSFVIHFRTGKGSARRGAKGRVVGTARIANMDAAALPCRDLFATQGCFDTITEIPAMTQSFEVAGNTALAWHVRTEKAGGEGAIFWPAQCGDPALIVRESRGNECFTLQAIGPGGLLAPRIRHCVSPTDPPTAASRRGFRDAGTELPAILALYEAVAAVPAEPAPPVESAAEIAPPAAKVEARPAAKKGCALGASDAPWWVLLALLAFRRRSRPA